MRLPSKLYCVFAILAVAIQGQALDDDEWSLASFVKNAESPDVRPFFPGTIQANVLMDKLLDKVRQEVDARGIDRFLIPNFENDFENKVAGVTVKGWFKGQNGWIESLRSIERRGDATVSINGPTVFVEASLGLGILRLGLDYDAKASILHSSGFLKATVASNTLTFTGGMDQSSGECRIVLQDLKVTNLGKIDIQVSKSNSLWDSIKSSIANKLTTHFHDRIQETLEKKMREVIEKKLAEMRC